MRHRKERELDERMANRGLCSIGSAIGAIGAVGSIFGDDNGAEGAANAGADASRMSAASSAASTAMSQDLFNFHKWNYRPLETSLIADAQKAGSQAEMDSRAGAAGATVSQQFGNARRDFTRNLAQYGVNPNSGKFVDMARTSAIDEAAATVGAQNNARQDERKFGLAAKADVISLGRGTPGTAMAGQAQAASAAGLAGQTANNAYNIAQQQNANTGTGLAAIGGYAQKLYDGYQKTQVPQTDYYPQRQSFTPSYDYEAFRKGGLVRPPSKHGYVKGGRVRGPGTGTSDSVPMLIDGERPGALSHGEYVLNAAATKKIGLKKLDEMNLSGLPEGSQMKDGVHLAEGGRVLPHPRRMAA